MEKGGRRMAYINKILFPYVETECQKGKELPKSLRTVETDLIYLCGLRGEDLGVERVSYNVL